MLLNSEETMNEWSEILFEKLWPTTVFVVVLIVVGVPGNLLVFFVYLKRFRPSAVRVFILAMAVCDFLTNVISLPLMIFHLRHFYNSVDSPTCKFIQASWRFPTITSVLLLVCVAIDRHRRICFPFKQQITHRQAMLILLLLLIITVLLTSPFVVFYGQIRCFLEEQYFASPWIKRTAILLMVLVAISVIILMVCYTHIVCRVRHFKLNRQRIGVNQPNKDDQGQQSKFSSEYSEPQQAWDSQNPNSNSDAKKDNFSAISSPETSFVDVTAQTTQDSLNTVLKEPLSFQMPVVLHVSSPVIETTVGVQMSVDSNLITKNITGPQQKDELTSENRPTFRVTEKEMKDEGKKTLERKDGGRKQTRFSKTTLMMLVLTMTTIILFVPHLVIEIWKGGCLDVYSPLMEMNICQVAHIFPYLNSVINPFIYSFCNPKFRLQCRLLLRGVYNNVFLPIRPAFTRDSVSR